MNLEEELKEALNKKLMQMQEAGAVIQDAEGNWKITDLEAWNRADFEAYKARLLEALQEAPWPLPFDVIATTKGQTPHEFLAYWIAVTGPLMLPEDRYTFTVKAYIKAPYRSIPKQTMRALRKIRPGDYLEALPEEWKDKDPITVYRGGGCTVNQALNSLSWTTDIKTACFFWGKAVKHHGPGPQLWTGTIKKADIIAVTNDRNEKEVIQYHSIKDIRPLELTEEQYTEYMNQRKKEAEEWNAGK